MLRRKSPTQIRKSGPVDLPRKPTAMSGQRQKHPRFHAAVLRLRLWIWRLGLGYWGFLACLPGITLKPKLSYGTQTQRLEIIKRDHRRLGQEGVALKFLSSELVWNRVADASVALLPKPKNRTDSPLDMGQDGFYHRRFMGLNIRAS